MEELALVILASVRILQICLFERPEVRHGLAEARVITPSFGSCDRKLSPGALVICRQKRSVV